MLTKLPPVHAQSQQSQRSRSRNDDGKNTMLVSNYYSVLMGPKDDKARDIVQGNCNIWKPNVKVVKSERGRHAELVDNGKL
jgi:lipoate-protein ligase B